MKSVGDALNRQELLRATVAVGAGAWPLAAGNVYFTGRSVLRIAPVDRTPAGRPRVTA